MIGPLVRSPKRAPRKEPLHPDGRRRIRNLIGDLVEFAAAPFGFWGLKRLIVETVEIHIADLPASFDGYRIAYLTDLHSSPIVPRWWIQRAVETALGLQPDVIALGGDYVHDDPRYAPGVAEILRPLHAPDGVFAVLGNHDHYVGSGVIRAALERAGVRELLNSSLRVNRGGAEIAVAGVGDLECDVIDFDAALGGVGGGVPRIVLSHDPDVFAYWPPTLRLDLMVAGHTHGGQAYLPIIGPPFVPSQFGFRYLAGLYCEGDRQLYVSRGVGASGVPMRWGCPPELTLIVLCPP